MIEATINIGLHIGDGRRKITALQCVDALNAEGVIVRGDVKVLKGDDEPTLTAGVVFPTDTDWGAVCAELGQEAIALLTRGHVGGAHAGVLVGPKAEDWGPFDPARFFLSSGRRLSDVLAQSEAVA